MKIVSIKGMHCRSCEILIEEELSKIDGVHKVIVSEKRGIAEVFSAQDIPDNYIENAVRNCGYSLGTDGKNLFSKNPKDYNDLVKGAVLLTAIYFVAKGLGLFNISFDHSNNLSSLPVVLLVGVTAGFSTCMALIGGLVLGVSARFSEKHPLATPLQKFKPHLYFNAGRIILFALFGALIGYFGSLIQMTPATIGILTIAVGLVMLLLGLQTTEVFPVLNKVKFTLPKQLYSTLGIRNQNQKEYSNKSSFILGGLTFFLPCGFTQAMQLYAISSGSPVTGALTMGLFALGTAPGLLGIAGLTAIIKGSFAKPFFKFVGLAVIALSLFNIRNGLNLSGVSLPAPTNVSANTSTKSYDPNVTIENGVQIVKMTQSYNGYSPRAFTIEKAIPVKWVITSKDTNTCASSIYSSQLNVRKYLSLGENIIEFIPKQTGVISFSCSMGMYTGSFTVIEAGDVSNNNSSGQTYGFEKDTRLAANIVTPANSAIVTAQPSGGSCSSGGGCGCGSSSGAKRNVPNINAVSTQAQIIPATDNTYKQTQLIKAIYTYTTDIQPNNFTVKANIPVRFEIDANDNGSGCMRSITLPGLVQNYELLQKDKKIVFNFTPTTAGSYKITCAMGIPRGTITAN